MQETSEVDSRPGEPQGEGNAAVRQDEEEEAAELSSLKPQLNQLGVPLYAVVKEDVGTEILNFKPFFNGDIFLDAKRRFYGPRERRMGLLAFLRVGVWTNGLRAFRNGFMGNVFGEGFILGGVYVLGPGEQGIILEHREIEFGDKVNILEVLKAVKWIQRELVSLEEITPWKSRVTSAN
ncbi:unnamed protein product [Lota lota]